MVIIKQTKEKEIEKEKNLFNFDSQTSQFCLPEMSTLRLV